jgi:hypothetical protein
MNTILRPSLLHIILLFFISHYIINYVFLPKNTFTFVAFGPDDYSLLRYTDFARIFSLHNFYESRPVSTAVAKIASVIGVGFGFAFLNLLMVLYAALVFVFVRLFLRQISVSKFFSWTAAVTAAVVIFSAPQIISHTKHFGGIVSFTSIVFGITAMLMLLQANRAQDLGKWGIYGSAAILSCFLSVMAKEDFILPVLILAGGLWVGDLREVNLMRLFAKRRDLIILFFMLIVALFAVYFNLRIAPNPHLLVGDPTYEQDWAFLSIAKTILKYHKLHFYIQVIDLAFLCGVVIAIVASSELRSKIIVLFLVIVAIRLPYAVLPQKVSEYYVYNWYLWEVAALTMLGALLFSKLHAWYYEKHPISARRYGAYVAAISSCLICVVWLILPLNTYMQRSVQLNWYREQGEINLNIIDTLLEYKTQLARYETIGIFRAPPLNPWLEPGGTFLRNRYGFSNKWILFINIDENPLGQIIVDAQKALGFPTVAVSGWGMEQFTEFRNIPMLIFGKNGKGRLELPDPGN